MSTKGQVVKYSTYLSVRTLRMPQSMNWNFYIYKITRFIQRFKVGLVMFLTNQTAVFFELFALPQCQQIEKSRRTTLNKDSALLTMGKRERIEKI